ncbi:MAG: P-loop NTPase [Thermoplasmata archaeon]|nr:Mrp/NBP35 family ATP-binding protein [Thermoplasmata archaeon]NIS12345.1 Mrp/NBP35 family ATP-binding protein [Thermoplasmata archaeon]NIS20265.1 Mrp/NBP35 family ATP-binding protein [Thermoplasmata archaeon]NIT77609.1 Mrp/NBP35 family ATP-binding protein [Thermoplasmata archaeon]NIU49356.1 Mrp/NBP35 family ATP-binding protein [Thermoplasmata archaeon]
MEETEEKSQLEENLQVLDNLARIKHKIVVMSGKGGVGKSTVAVNLALTLADQGHKVGVMDVDIHGPDVAKLLGVEDERLQSMGDLIVPVRVNENLSAISMAFLLEDRDTPIVWRGPLKMSAIRQFLGEVAWGDLDYLVIDLPPGTGDEPLSVAQLIPDGAWAVVVTTPQDLALLDSRKAIRFAEALKMNVAGVVENMAGFKCPHCGEDIDLFKIGGGEAAAEEMEVPFLGRIPIDPQMVTMGDLGQPYVVNEPDETAPRAFREIAERLEARVSDGK